MKYFIVSIVLLVSSFTTHEHTKTLSISGTIDADLKVIFLYKFQDIFNKKLIAEIPVIDGCFFFSKSLNEVDTYQLKHPNENKYFTFVWDADIKCKINSGNFTLSKVFNSPLTAELNTFDSTRYAIYIEPIKQLDTLIDRTITSKLSFVDSLENKRDSIFSSNQEGFRKYTNSYVKSHPASFISLLKLTDVSPFLVTDEDRQLLNALSDTLKKHSRYRRFIAN